MSLSMLAMGLVGGALTSFGDACCRAPHVSGDGELADRFRAAAFTRKVLNPLSYGSYLKVPEVCGKRVVAARRWAVGGGTRTAACYFNWFDASLELAECVTARPAVPMCSCCRCSTPSARTLAKRHTTSICSSSFTR